MASYRDVLPTELAAISWSRRSPLATPTHVRIWERASALVAGRTCQDSTT
jgi:hypothetical protein